MKILLLNPPFDRMVIRDYCCGHTSKADYCWVPIDLLALSGVLSERHDVNVIDSIIMRHDKPSTLKKIKKIKPDAIISLVSAITVKSDMEFLSLVKETTDAEIYVIGDVAYFDPKNILKEYKFLDGIVFDFTSKGILELIENEENPKDVAFRKGNEIFIGKKSKGKISYNMPRHEKFSLKKYNMPYSRHNPTTTLLTTYGCPYNCTFCPSGKLPYRIRELDNIVEELKYISELGIKEVYVRDFTFTGNKVMVRDFCRKIKENNIKISWSCDGRVDNVDYEMLIDMKNAGCYLIFFGIESAIEQTLIDVHKGIGIDKIKKAIELCKRVGINTLGSFIIGLPNDTKESILSTIKFSKELELDYASFNLFVPRYGTDLREALKNDDKVFHSMDSSIEVESVCGIPEENLKQFHNMAIKEFYLRPKYIMKSLLDIHTFMQFRNLIKNGISVLKGI